MTSDVATNEFQEWILNCDEFFKIIRFLEFDSKRDNFGAKRQKTKSSGKKNFEVKICLHKKIWNLKMFAIRSQGRKTTSIDAEESKWEVIIIYQHKVSFISEAA